MCVECRHVRMNETYEQMNSWVDFGNTWVRGERDGVCGGALRWKNERLRGFVCEWVERSRQSHKVVVRSVSRTMFGCLVLVAGLECTLIPWFWALPHPCTRRSIRSCKEVAVILSSGWWSRMWVPKWCVTGSVLCVAEVFIESQSYKSFCFTYIGSVLAQHALD